jgi:cardiolipin-specific phospholipase
VYLNTIELVPPEFAAANTVPVVVAHGMGAGLATFYRNFDDLAMMNGGRRVLAFDWLGMGRSSRPRYPKRNAVFPQDVTANEADSVEWFVGSMELWRQAMAVEQMDLVAHSMGGYFCTVYALRHPERVRRLVLVSPCGLPCMPESGSSADSIAAPHSASLASTSPVAHPGMREHWAQVCMALWRWNITPQDILRIAGPLIRNMTQRCVETRYAQVRRHNPDKMLP